MNSHRIVGGLDLSYTGTACIALAGDGTLVARKLISTSPKNFPCRPARLVAIRQQVLEFFDEHQPSFICVENYAFGARQGREEAGELGGQARVALWENGFAYGNVAPGTLKAFVTGKGNCEKSMMLREVFRKWAYEAKDDNDADAFGLAQMALVATADPSGLTKVQRGILCKIERVDARKNA